MPISPPPCLSDYNLIEAKLTEYESGNEYSGTVVGEGTHHTVITGLTLTGENVEFTEEQMAAALKNLEVKKSE